MPGAEGDPAAARSLPRLAVAGTAGDAGKTLVSVGLALEARRAGLAVRAFKKGPDYIDAAWLTFAAGRPARNLDSFLMGFEGAAASFRRHAVPRGLNIVEGNRGLYDGLDAQGTHSTAELAKALQAPVVLVVNATKVTRSAAAWVLGCQKLDPEVHIAGVILNQVAAPRHEQILREAVESACGIPVLGAIPRLRGERILPWRHLGLVTPAEHPDTAGLDQRLMKLLEGRLDLERLLAIAHLAPHLDPAPALDSDPALGAGLKVGCVQDSAFTFYYPENIEALESAGAKVVSVSSLSGTALPAGLDALYVGGGFPETQALALSENRVFLGSLREACVRGLPVYAECGGLMLLARAIRYQGRHHPMAGVLPFEVEMCDAPQGHGYAVLTVDRPNPFFPAGVTLKGHEFHYSRIVPEAGGPPTAARVDRGVGCFEGRDGVTLGNVWASYTHLHALGAPEWAGGLLAAARRFSTAPAASLGPPQSVRERSRTAARRAAREHR
ncbi:MAG: cobyrinate a,c-diamide synthase [Acidobacteria bacterium]|nr:cobyrinate a,c-diamide synthase [Acidobacteriota bacterium]